MSTIDPAAALMSLPPTIATALAGIPSAIDALGQRVRAGTLDPEDAADTLAAAFVPVFAAMREA